MSGYDAIVIGAGHNGLVTAARLARAGVKTIVLERRPVVGGASVTEEFHPGFRVSTLAHTAQPAASVVQDLKLREHGLELIHPDPYVFAPLADGRSLILGRDVAASAASIGLFSSEDAAKYQDFQATLSRIGAFISEAMAAAPPDIEHTQRSDLWSMLKTGRRLRRLGRRDAYRLLRWSPMSAADFVSEWFESEPLRAVLAGRGIFGTAMGPRSAGSTAVLLMHMAGGMPTTLVRGGLGAFATALASAARAAGADIRVSAPVARIDVRNGRVSGVTLVSGEALAAPVVVSNADPRHTLLALVDPIELEPSFLARVRNYRCAGNVAKINLALSELPAFTALPAGNASALSGRIHIGPGLDYLERAFDASKYGAWSARPYLDITIPSITDPSLAPAGAHVMSINAQFAPYRLRGGDWASSKDAFGDAVVETLAEYAPALRRAIVQRQIITPADLESDYGLTGGHIFHGELALDQLFTMRPLLGSAQYRMPIGGLFLCGAGTHPGYGVSGLSGTLAAKTILRSQ